jgi:glycosyltransferase involved in cell wall biosynthesis
MTRFCIVIPTSDSIATLPAAVDSALAQDHPDFKVYVSDNASHDGTAAYIASRNANHLVTCAHAKRVGKTANWNRAFEGAPFCEIFVMLHSDDTLSPDALGQIDRAYRKFPATALVYGNHDVLSLDGTKIGFKKMWPLAYAARGHAFDRLQVLNNAASVVGCSFPKGHYHQIGGFDPRYEFYQDMEFFHQLGKLGEARYIPAKLGLYRAAPIRPVNRLRFYCEEITWLTERVGAWPLFFGERIRLAWARGAHRHLRLAHPDLLTRYEEHLATVGIKVEMIEKQQIPRIKVHTCYKLWLSFLALVRMKP